MANAFMPSAFASMAGAGQDTLEQIMKQRLFEQQLMQSQVGMQRQVNADLEQSRRFDAQERYQQGLIGAREQAIQAQLQIAQEKAQQAQMKAAAEARAARNTAGAADMYFTGLTRGEDANSPAMLRVASEGGLSSFERAPKPEKSLSDKVAETTALEEARQKTRARFKEPKAGPKPKAEDLTAPPALLEEIRRYRDMDLPEWRDADTAMASIRANWQKLQQQFGNSLDLNTVIRKLGNVYGTKVKTKRGDDDFPDDGYPQ
jgi:hypothetical protein